MVERSPSPNSSIEGWLDSQPDQPQDYELAHPNTSGRKRRAYQAVTGASNKRRALMEIPENAVRQTSGRKLRSSNDQPPLATPTRQGPPARAAQRPPVTTNHEDPIPQDLDYVEEDELVQSPTPRQNPLGMIPTFHARPANPQLNASPSQTPSSESGNSRDSTKSRS